MKQAIVRGEIYYADLNPVIGSEQGGRRPVLIVQNDIGNRHGMTIVVAAISTKGRVLLPTHVSLADICELHPKSILMLEQLRTIDKQRLGGRIAVLDRTVMRLVDIALSVSLGLSRSSNIQTLCPHCVKQYRNTDDYILRRIDFDQRYREPCTLCSVRTGYDFEVIKK